MPITGSVSHASANAGAGAYDGVTSLAFTHTADGNPLYVIASIYTVYYDNTTTLTVTFGGTALTQIHRGVRTGNTLFCFTLAAPVAGTAQVAITLSASRKITAAAVNLRGFPSDPAALTFATKNGTYTGAQPFIDIASVAGAEIIDSVHWNNDSNTIAAASSQTIAWNQYGPVGRPDQRSAGGITTGTGAAGALNRRAWTFAGPHGDIWAMLAMSYTDLAAVDVRIPRQKVTQQALLVGYDEDAEQDVPDDPSPCAGGGTVASGTDPSADITLAGKPSLRHWIEVDVYDGSSTITLRDAGEAINDAERKAPGVTAFGTIVRASSNQFGGVETARVTSIWADALGVLRGYHATGVLLGQRIRYYTAAIADIQAGNSARRRRFSGIVDAFGPLPDGSFRISSVDAFSVAGATFDQEKLLPQELITGDISDHTPTDYLLDKPVPRGYGGLSDAASSAPIGVMPTTYVSQTSQFVPTLSHALDMYLVLGGVMTNIQQVIGADYLSGEAEPTTRAVLGETFWGVSGWHPFHPSWPFPDRYITMAGRRYTPILLLQNHIVSTLARSGRVPLTVNGCCEESIGNSLGTLITNPAWVALHIVNTRVAQEATGNHPALASEDGYSLFDYASFQAAAAICDTLGLTAAGILGRHQRQITLRELEASFSRSFGLTFGTDRHGRRRAFMLNRAVGTYTREYNDVSHIPEGEFEVDPQTARMANELAYAFAQNYVGNLADLNPAEGARLPRDPLDGQWRSGRRTLANDTAITALGGRPRGLRPAQDVIEMDWVEDEDTAETVMQRELDLRSPVQGRPRVRFSVHSQDGGADHELGEIIRVRHGFLPGSPLRCEIQRLEDNLDTDWNTIEAESVEDLLPPI